MIGMYWRIAIKHGPAGDQIRPQTYVGRDVLAPMLEIFGMATGIANSCDTISEKKRERQVGIPYMHMHVPQAGDEVESACINSLSIFRWRNALRGADPYDSVTLDDDRFVWLWWRAGG